MTRVAHLTVTATASPVPAATSNDVRWTRYGAALTLAGALLSGPVALVVVALVKPEPAWRDAATFVAHWSWLRTLPFFLGFGLVGGLLTLIAGLHRLAPEELKARTTVALGLAAAFTALVLLNYTLQTTFVPLLVMAYREIDAPLLSALTMSNPRSLGWCLEMWAYAAIGVASWLVAPVFSGAGLERAARVAFVTNGPVSVGSALLTAFAPGWALCTAGLVAFMTWNLLVVMMCWLTLAVLRHRIS